VTARTGGALHVDRVLADPLGVPRGLDHSLRRMERSAREQRDVLARLAERADAAAPVRAVAQELERFLEDESRSPLLRALQRPLPQIAPDTPGGRSLQRCWEGVRARAEGAVELQAALDGIRAAVGRMRERFGEELPRTTRNLLRRERLEENDLARVGRAHDVNGLYRRLRHVERELERLWRLVDAGAGAQLQRGKRWAEEVAPGELLALLQVRLRERERLLHERDQARTLRLLAARQVQALAQARTPPLSARDPSHAVAQRLATLLLRGDAGVSGAEDLALWGELLGSASDALHQPGRATAWAAQLDPPALPGERDFGSAQFVIPIDDGYALITPELPSCIRISSRSIKLDRKVECSVFLEHGDAETLPLARMDVEPLFDGLEGEPAWYSTARRAQLQVIAGHGRGWIARLVRRGTIARSRVAAWQPERQGHDRLRVLGTLSTPAPATPLAVGPTGAEAHGFCGLLSLPVATPLAECAEGWLRLVGHSAWSVDAVEAEEACFRAVARQVPLTVPVCAGRGRLDGHTAGGPLYVPPLGLRAADLPPLDTWLRSSSSRPLLESVARLWLRLVGAGYGIGAYHVDAFVFSLGWGGPKQQGPAAHAVVAEAPFAARLGQSHRPPPRDEALFPAYEGLGCRVLPAAVVHGGVALPATEAQAFALFALDTLARKPLPTSGIVDAEAVAEMVPQMTELFAHPELAVRLAQVLLPEAETSHVIDWIQTLAEPRGG
jgi:hypothetical protein